jgi:ribosomal protein S18 acetylase RimI-like enzyme
MRIVSRQFSNLEIRPVSRRDAASLSVFFRQISAAGYEKHFHPHPLSVSAARGIALKKGKDIYAIGLLGRQVVAYGMLRGWDEGFAIPSLGLAVHPDTRKKGLGRAMLAYLHASAALRGAPAVRLKVYPRNRSALRLYGQMGYQFAGDEGGQLVGYCDLGRSRSASHRIRGASKPSV